MVDDILLAKGYFISLWLYFGYFEQRMLILGLPYHLYLCLLSLNGYFLLLILLHLMPLYTLRLILAYLTTIFVLYFIILVNLFLI